MKQTLNNTEDILMVHYYLFIRKKESQKPQENWKKIFLRKSMLLMCNKTNLHDTDKQMEIKKKKLFDF